MITSIPVAEGFYVADCMKESSLHFTFWLPFFFTLVFQRFEFSPYPPTGFVVAHCVLPILCCFGDRWSLVLLIQAILAWPESNNRQL